MNAEDVVADIKSNMTDKKRKRYSTSQARRSVKRPEEILRDVRGLKLRQRVSLVLGDEILREELEESIRNSTVNGVTRLDTIRAYQDFLLPALQPNLVSIGKGIGGGASTVLPINDIRGENTSEFSKSERILRCKLAAVYRLVDIFGWSEAIFNHISVRPNTEKDEFLLNPFGFLFSEVTSSSLVKVDPQGNVIHGGSTDLGINKAGFVLHSTIHQSRPDVHCVIHIHTANVVAVASMKCGFLRLSQESLVVGGVSYHDYCGILVDEAEKESIKNDLGPDNMVMFLRNHGVVVCGKTIEDAFMLLSSVVDSCEVQVKSVCVGLENLNIISDEAYDNVQETMKEAASKIIKGEGGKPRMTLSEYFFEAYMRWLDSQGYRTGYVYHMPDIFISGTKTKKNPECRIPPNVPCSDQPPHQVYYNYHGPDSLSPSHKPISMGRGNTHRARLKWLNSPVIGTQYIKEEKQKSAVSPSETPMVNGSPAKKHDSPEHIVQNGIDHHDTPLVNGDLSAYEDASADTPNVSVIEDVKKEEHNVVINRAAITVESVISETTVTVTETELVPNGDNAVADTSNATANAVPDSPRPNNVESPAVSPTKSTNSSDGQNILSDNDTTPDAANADGSKPPKVKKQKSFKKALMKKFNKKEEKKEDSK